MAKANVNMAYVRRTVEDFGRDKGRYYACNYNAIAANSDARYAKYAKELHDINEADFLRQDVKLTAIAQTLCTSQKILKDWFRTCERVKSFREKYRAFEWFLDQAY